MKKHKKVEILFRDHSVGIEGIAMCRVVGYIIGEEKEYYKLSFWLVDTNCAEVFKSNLEPFSILKSAIIKKKILK